jgi:hypothetical protein
VDRIARAQVVADLESAIPLVRIAIEETGFGGRFRTSRRELGGVQRFRDHAEVEVIWTEDASIAISPAHS